MKRLNILLLISFLTIYAWATSSTVYDFANISEDDIITSDGVIGIKVYGGDQDTFPSVSKPEEIEEIHVRINRMDGLELSYKSNTSKENIFIFRDNYVEFAGKWCCMEFSDLNYGDTIRLLVASKGNSDPTFTILSGGRGEDQVVPSTKESLSYNEYKIVEFYATESTAVIKETTAGFQIMTATIAPFECPEAEVVMDTIYACQFDSVYVTDRLYIITSDILVRDTLVTVEGCDSVKETFVKMLPSYLIEHVIPVPVGDTSVIYNGQVLPLGITNIFYKTIDDCDSIWQYRVEEDSTMTRGSSDVRDITHNSATIKWVPDSTVSQYEINIYQTQTLFAQYIVGGDGQIISSQQFTPSIHKMPMDTTTSSTDYFVISLDGLGAGTDYSYTITGTNAQNTPVYHVEGSFTTLNPEGLMDAVADDPHKQVRKIIRDGQLVILREEKEYTPQGQQVK